MDKFFYRLIVQTLWKGLLTVLLTFLGMGVIYTIFISILQPVSAVFDYWLQFGLTVAIAAVCCFFMLFVGDDYRTDDLYSYSVGKFWNDRVYAGKKVGWLLMELIMFPLLALAVLFGYLAYVGHAGVLSAYTESFAASVDITVELALDQWVHFLEIICAVFLLLQWRHVRAFAKAGRCPNCKAAFSLGYHRSGGVTTDYSSKISKKGRTAVVGESYKVTTSGGKEVDRTKVADLYGTVYDYYQTDTKTTSYQNICRCGFCGKEVAKFDSYASSTTKKL